MSQTGLLPGLYYIVNSQLTPDGSQLAVNYARQNTPLTVSARQDLYTEQWNVIGQEGTLQQIVPAANYDLQAAAAGNYVEALPASDYTWYITASGDGYLIQDKTKQYVWGINRAADGETVMFESATGDPLQVWNFNAA